MKKVRKVILPMMLSLDGYFEGPNHDLSWHNVDKEFNKVAIKLMNEVDLIIFGRRTYQTMESFWPRAQDDPKISKDNLIIARLMSMSSSVCAKLMPQCIISGSKITMPLSRRKLNIFLLWAWS